jgi:hypothetical protein
MGSSFDQMTSKVAGWKYLAVKIASNCNPLERRAQVQKQTKSDQKGFAAASGAQTIGNLGLLAGCERYFNEPKRRVCKSLLLMLVRAASCV